MFWRNSLFSKIIRQISPTLNFLGSVSPHVCGPTGYNFNGPPQHCHQLSRNVSGKAQHLLLTTKLEGKNTSKISSEFFDGKFLGREKTVMLLYYR